MLRPLWSLDVWLTFSKRKWIFLAAVPFALALGAAAFVLFGARHALERAGTTVAGQGRYAVELLRLASPEDHASKNPGFEAIATPATYVSGAFYEGKLYVSGPSGLSVYGAGNGTDAALLKQYRVGLDLPAAPLGAMAVGRLRGASGPELLIATRGEGVLIFSGDGAGNGAGNGSGSFRQLRPANADARDVTAILPLATGELLLGTRKLGVLLYAGEGRGGQNGSAQALTVYHPLLAGLDVTAFAADETGFWVGTRNHGLRHVHGGAVEAFEGAGEGGDNAAPLPDPQIESIAVRGNRVYAGTPLGVEEFVDGRPARLLARNIFASSLFAEDRAVTVGSLSDGIQRVSLEASHRPGGFHSAEFDAAEGDATAPAQQFLDAGPGGVGKGTGLYAVTKTGLLQRRVDGGWSAWSPVGGKKTAVLADGNVSALAFDPDGRLWVGYFDRGLDILAADGQSAEHHEEEPLFCVNRLVYDARKRRMAVATADGLVLFNEMELGKRGRARQVLTRRDGLIADHVTDVAFAGETMVLATPAGLTYVDGAGARSLYAFEGLVNNHVYALGVGADGGVLAGTLGGVSVLEKEAVVRNLSARNSGLKQNWVTALAALPGKAWMVGTYGAGVMRLGQDGRFAAMEGGTRAMVVNPNAMLSTGGHVYVGTLGQGLWAWSAETDRWSQVTAGLPSENVTALAERGGELYVGTENGLVRIAEERLP